LSLHSFALYSNASFLTRYLTHPIEITVLAKNDYILFHLDLVFISSMHEII